MIEICACSASCTTTLLREDTDLYLNVDETKEVSMGSYNNTPGGGKVMRLSSDYKAGPAFVLRLLPGDKVDAEVWAAFEGTNFDEQASLSTMIAAVAGAFGGVSGAGGEAGNIYDLLNEAMGVLGLPSDAGSTVPNAYLNWIFMDEFAGFDDATQKDDGGFVAIPASSYQSKKLVEMDEFVAQKPGYLYIYLSFEEENTSYYVHFDDFKITYTPSRLIQATDYYPFGASHSTSWTRETATPNPYLYNAGSELNESTKWYETAFRSYDPYIGRFTGVDAMASMFGGLNPYQYAFNSPCNFNDPLGLCPCDNPTTRDPCPCANEKNTEHHDASSGGGQNDGGKDNPAYGTSAAYYAEVMASGMFGSPFSGGGMDMGYMGGSQGQGTGMPMREGGAVDNEVYYGRLLPEMTITPKGRNIQSYDDLLSQAGSSFDAMPNPSDQYSNWDDWNDANDAWIASMGADNYEDALDRWYKTTDAYQRDQEAKGKHLMNFGFYMAATWGAQYRPALLPRANPFTVPSRGINIRNHLISNQYFVSTRGEGYWAQPGHYKFSPQLNRLIISSGQMSRASNGTWRFSYRVSLTSGRTGLFQLGVRPDGGIMHSTFYKIK